MGVHIPWGDANPGAADRVYNAEQAAVTRFAIEPETFLAIHVVRRGPVILRIAQDYVFGFDPGNLVELDMAKVSPVAVKRCLRRVYT